MARQVRQYGAWNLITETESGAALSMREVKLAGLPSGTKHSDGIGGKPLQQTSQRGRRNTSGVPNIAGRKSIEHEAVWVQRGSDRAG